MDEQIAERAPKKMRKKTILRVHDVCRATLYNYRYRIITGQQKPLVGRKGICEQFGVPMGNVEHSYGKWINWTTTISKKLDQVSLLGILVEKNNKKVGFHNFKTKKNAP